MNSSVKKAYLTMAFIGPYFEKKKIVDMGTQLALWNLTDLL